MTPVGNLSLSRFPLWFFRIFLLKIPGGVETPQVPPQLESPPQSQQQIPRPPSTCNKLLMSCPPQLERWRRCFFGRKKRTLLKPELCTNVELWGLTNGERTNLNHHGKWVWVGLGKPVSRRRHVQLSMGGDSSVPQTQFSFQHLRVISQTLPEQLGTGRTWSSSLQVFFVGLGKMVN